MFQPFRLPGLVAVNLFVLGYAAHATTVSLDGNSFGGFPGYGTSLAKNNVVNYGLPGLYGPSGLWDATRGAAWKGGGTVSTTLSHYDVD
jgi:hypothetical protein